MTLIDDHFFPTNATASMQILEWLKLSNSLTDKLHSLVGSTHLKLINQQWINTSWWQKKVLHICDEQVFQREIMMQSSGINYWYAKTIIPEKCYRLSPNFFNRLENEPIKNLIFGNPDIYRKQIITYAINEQCIEFHWLKKITNFIPFPLWVRLVEYSLYEKESFYVIELLFPELEGVLL